MLGGSQNRANIKTARYGYDGLVDGCREKLLGFTNNIKEKNGGCDRD